MNNTDFERLGEVNDPTLLDIDHIFNWQRDFDAVAVVVGPKYDLLECLDPFLSANTTVRSKMVHSFICDEGEVFGVFAFLLRVNKSSRYTVLQVDISTWKVGI